MRGQIIRFLAFAAVLTTVQESNAAEIITQCPRINDAGKRLTVQKLLLDDFMRKTIHREDRDLAPPDSGKEMKWTFWRAGMAPITEVSFSCTYADGSLYHIPIPGWLLHCMAVSRKEDWWIESCTSETDPGLRLGK
jgi:hypothetical protein